MAGRRRVRKRGLKRWTYQEVDIMGSGGAGLILSRVNMENS